MASIPEPEFLIANLQRELAWAYLKIESLEEKLRQERIKLLGPRSETLSDLQLNLLLNEEPGVAREEVEGEANRERIEKAPPRIRQRNPGRNPLPAHLPRLEEVVPCPSLHCNQCGAETTVIGYDESEVLDKQPARYFVRVIKREKRVCNCGCAKRPEVMMPELAPRIVPKGLASDRVVVDTLVAKYCDHLPLYRQAVMLEREAGIEIGRATLDGWVMQAGELLIPVVGAMRQDLLRASYLQADETTVLVQMHDKSGADHQAYLWQYSKPGGETVFDFCLGRSREGPKQFLGGWEGILQTDGYQGYDKIGGPKLVHAGCWAHARRYYIDAVKVNPNDADAIAMVKRMDALFLVDRRAKELELTASQRMEERQRESVPVVDEILKECRELSRRVLPSSTIGKAVGYTLNQWPRLRRCLEHAEVELSNNWAENSMRGIAVGRKNWLHVGDKTAGPKVAAILSVIESCRRIGVSARDYLLAVLPGMDRRKLTEVAQFTPAHWAAGKS